MSRPKKKADRKRRRVAVIEAYERVPGSIAATFAEARASVSLDGETQYCKGCSTQIDHSCGKRPMTAEEAKVVEAAMAWVDVLALGSFEPAPGTEARVLFDAVRSLRDSHKKGRSGR